MATGSIEITNNSRQYNVLLNLLDVFARATLSRLGFGGGAGRAGGKSSAAGLVNDDNVIMTRSGLAGGPVLEWRRCALANDTPVYRPT